MKYQLPTEIIPQDQRKEINDKILYLIETNTCEANDITPQDIYNSFTGKGKLHNLKFEDFENYYEYSEAKKIEEEGQFFTSPKVCQFMVDCIKPTDSDLICDLTYGMGAFFNFCPNEHNIYGTELDLAAYKVAKFLYPNANLSNEDIRLYDPDVKFDIVFGNPPFNLKWNYEKETYLSQLFYFIKSFDVLNPGGILALIVPVSFLKDDFMDRGMIETVDSKFNFIYQASLPKNAFKEVGVNSFETKVMFFQKKSGHVGSVKYKTDIESVRLNSSDEIHNRYIKPVLEEKKKVHAKILLEALASSSEDVDFQYKVKKLLFDIKNSKHTKAKYAKAANYVNEYYTQKCPDTMDYEQWEKIKITKNKVLSYLKRILKNQHIVERDEIKLVKDNYGLRMKAYSKKSKLQLKKYKTTKASFNEMVLNDNYPFDYLTYKKLVDKKNVRYEKNQIKFKDLTSLHLKEIVEWIDKNPIQDYSKNETLILTEKQKLETARTIYKGMGILNFEQGSGKSLCAITFYNYFRNKVKNVFVVGNALGINLTWNVILKDYREDFILIDSLEKIQQIKPKQVILISYNMLRKYEKHVKRFVKMGSQKFTLILDESDNLINHVSKRTQVVRSIFSKVKYKLFTSGTVTRNSISELYSQLEVMYNNSINMLCQCEYVYKWNQKEEKLNEELNSYYMKPFPAKYGNGLFKACFNPYKQTVFGIKKQNQSVYNSEFLKEILEKTIITRSFFDITGKKPQFETIKVEQNQAEEYVYSIIINEFYKVICDHFKNTGNSRKEALLKIIRQIQLLIKSCSVPEIFKDYNSNEIPGKQKSIFEKVDEYRNEKIAIGTIFKPSVNLYFNRLKNLYPDRPIFLINGAIPFKKRKLILKDFETTKNGILVTTQQALESSVSVPSCNIVIIESLMWNMSRMSQFYMRFIRFNSKNIEAKKIIFFVYSGSIEMNLIALIFDKEKLNLFIKGNEVDKEDVFKEYGVDIDILNEIVEKVIETVEGKSQVRLAWGKAKIV